MHCITRCACRCHASTQCRMDHRDLWPGWAPSLSKLHTLYQHLTQCSPVTSCTPPHSVQGARTCQDQRWGLGGGRTWMFWSYLYRVTGQPSIFTFSHPMPHCGGLSHHTRQHWAMWPMQSWPAALNEQLHSLNSRPPLHGLALTNFLDCNTRHVECSTCCVPSSGTHKHIHTTQQTPQQLQQQQQ